ncbi:hypothetical protein HMPREF0262_02674 [Clostridium sp. ATCC 29733]|nr:hypothetical protein HMPREF0262_02674 [Clostridium sp. ATCC 29733]
MTSIFRDCYTLDRQTDRQTDRKAVFNRRVRRRRTKWGPVPFFIKKTPSFDEKNRG